MGTDKIKSRPELAHIIRQQKKEGRKIVFTNGCFDIIHPGHLSYLATAKALGDILVIGVNSDESVKRLKGNNRPILNQNERTLILSYMEMIDYLCIFDEDTPYELIKAIEPDILVKGGDWAVENIVGKDILEAYGGKVISIPYLEGASTTNIVERIIKKHGVKS